MTAARLSAGSIALLGVVGLAARGGPGTSSTGTSSAEVSGAAPVVTATSRDVCGA